MEITNPQVVSFANNRARVLADKFASLRRECIAFVEDYNAQDIGTKIDASGAGNLIADGSETDGRPRITGGAIYNLTTLAGDFATDVDAFMDAGRASVVNGIQVNGNR